MNTEPKKVGFWSMDDEPQTTTQEETIMNSILSAVEIEATKRAWDVLAGADLTKSWCEAGYHTALEAASALVGHTGDRDVEQAAAELVARWLRA